MSKEIRKYLLTEDLDMEITLEQLRGVEAIAGLDLRELKGRDLEGGYMSLSIREGKWSLRGTLTKNKDAVEYNEKLLLSCLGLVGEGRNKGMPIQVYWQAQREAEKQGINWGGALARINWTDTGNYQVWAQAYAKNYLPFFETYKDVQEFVPKAKEKCCGDKENCTSTCGEKEQQEIQDKWEKHFCEKGNSTTMGKEPEYLKFWASNTAKVHRVFETGSKRDSDHNKPLVKDMDPYVRLRYGYHMMHNAKKYSKGNWELGQPTDSLLESMHRHLAYYEQDIKTGNKSKEDHLSAILFGIKMIMLNEEREGVDEKSFYVH